MAIKLKAELDDRQLVAAADRSAKALKGVGAAGAAAGQAIDKGVGAAAKPVESIGERFDKAKNSMNKMLLGSVGYMALAKAGQFTAQVFGKVAEEAKGVDKAVYSSAKNFEMWAKVAQFDFAGAADDWFNSANAFDTAKLDKKLAPIQARMKFVDERLKRQSEEESGNASDAIANEQRFNQLVFARYDADANALVTTKRMTEQHEDQRVVLARIVDEAEKLKEAKGLTESKTKELAAREAAVRDALLQSGVALDAMKSKQAEMLNQFKDEERLKMSAAEGARRLVELEKERVVLAKEGLLVGERLAKHQREVAAAVAGVLAQERAITDLQRQRAKQDRDFGASEKLGGGSRRALTDQMKHEEGIVNNTKAEPDEVQEALQRILALQAKLNELDEADRGVHRDIANMDKDRAQRLELETKNWAQLADIRDESLRKSKEENVGAEERVRLHERARAAAAKLLELKDKELETEKEIGKVQFDAMLAKQKARDEAKAGFDAKAKDAVRALFTGETGAGQAGAGGGDGFAQQQAQRRRGIHGGMIGNMMMQGPGLFKGPGLLGPLSAPGGSLPEYAQGGGPGGVEGMVDEARRRAESKVKRDRRRDIEDERDLARRKVMGDDTLDAAGKKKAWRQIGMDADDRMKNVGRNFKRDLKSGAADAEMDAAESAAMEKLADENAKLGGLNKEGRDLHKQTMKIVLQVSKEQEQTRRDLDQIRQLQDAARDAGKFRAGRHAGGRG